MRPRRSSASALALALVGVLSACSGPSATDRHRTALAVGKKTSTVKRATAAAVHGQQSATAVAALAQQSPVTGPGARATVVATRTHYCPEIKKINRAVNATKLEVKLAGGDVSALNLTTFGRQALRNISNDLTRATTLLFSFAPPPIRPDMSEVYTRTLDDLTAAQEHLHTALLYSQEGDAGRAQHAVANALRDIARSEQAEKPNTAFVSSVCGKTYL